MPNKIGINIAKFGAKLWTEHGYETAEDYGDLPFLGKLGYQICCEGMKIAFGTNISEIVDFMSHNL